MATTQEYALLSLYVYQVKDAAINRPDLPQAGLCLKRKTTTSLVSPTASSNVHQRAKIIGTGNETQLSVTADKPSYGTYAWGKTSWATDGALINGLAAPGFSDLIYATAAGTNGSVIHGYGGNDALSGSSGKDDIFGDEGDDLIGGGAERVQGGADDDVVYGLGGDNSLTGRKITTRSIANYAYLTGTQCRFAIKNASKYSRRLSAQDSSRFNRHRRTGRQVKPRHMKSTLTNGIGKRLFK